MIVIDTQQFQVIRTDLLSGIDNRLNGLVDVLVCNPPYVTTEQSELGGTGLTAAWAGGKLGLEVTK